MAQNNQSKNLFWQVLEVHYHAKPSKNYVKHNLEFSNLENAFAFQMAASDSAFSIEEIEKSVRTNHYKKYASKMINEDTKKNYGRFLWDLF